MNASVHLLYGNAVGHGNKLNLFLSVDAILQFINLGISFDFTKKRIDVWLVT